MIEPENNVIKVKPEEVELFPHSDSKLWDAFKKKSDIENNDNAIVSKNKNSNSDNTEKKYLTLNDTENKRSESDGLDDKNIQPSKIENKNNLKNKKDFKLAEKEPKIKIANKDDKNKLNNENEIKVEKVKSKLNIEQKENINNPKNEIEKKKDKKELKTKFYYIQLASVSNEKLVPIEWKRLSGIYPEISKKTYEYKKINLKSGNIYYRILLGKFKTKKESEEYCLNILKKSKCIIKSYE